MKEVDRLRLKYSLAWKSLLVIIVIALFGPQGVLREEPWLAEDQQSGMSDEGKTQAAQRGAGEYRDIELLRQRL